MADSIIRTEKGSVIQHGESNDRLYLMKVSKEDFPGIIDKINDIAMENRYGKIFAKVPVWMLPSFIANGYITEAHIPGYIRGKTDLFFVSRFLSSDRLRDIENDKLNELSAILRTVHKGKTEQLPVEFKVRKLTTTDAIRAASLFKMVFKTYPFPIHDPEYIKAMMKEETFYFGIQNSKKELIAISSAEVDLSNQTAEMTDFAVSPVYRGRKLSVLLLEEMEVYMKKINIKTLYTIARLNSIPMNRTFLGLGYKYSGTLIKNTNIAGKIESMNVLYKRIID